MSSDENTKDQTPSDAEETAPAAQDETVAESAADGAPGSLEDELQQAISDRDAKHELWLRSQAELENVRRRTRRELEDAARYRNLDLIRDLLPVLDNLKRAVDAAAGSKNVDELLSGLEMTLKQFDDVLSRHAVSPIEAADQQFDPNLHEAIQQMPSAEHPAMTVLAEVERGYRLHDRVIRPSRVIVSSGAPQTDDSQQN